MSTSEKKTNNKLTHSETRERKKENDINDKPHKRNEYEKK